MCTGDTFHSLVDIAFSLEPNSLYKTSLGSLLCALCCVNNKHFSLMLENCENVLSNRLDMVNRLLSTLAQVAHSHSCSDILLKSDLLSRMVSELTNGFEKLLDMLSHPLAEEMSGQEVPQANSARDTLSYICTLLAFFTDFMRNWMPGKVWMASKEIRHSFWTPMLHFLSMDTSIVSPQEVTFVQEVAYEFFDVSLQTCQEMKSVFVSLVCDVLRKKCILTQFLHKILIGLVFQDDSIPIIVRLLVPKSRKDMVLSHSFPLTYEAHYHPSYPLGESCYYLQFPSSTTLLKLDGMLKGLRPNQLHVSKAPTKHSFSSLAAQKRALHALKTGAASAGVDNLCIGDVDMGPWVKQKIKDIRVQSSAGTAAGGGASTSKCLHFSAASYRDEDILSCDSLAVFKQNAPRAVDCFEANLLQIIPDHDGWHSSYPLMAVMDDSALVFNARYSPALQSQLDDMFNLFLSCGGLLPLARCLPLLYSYHWPSSLRTEPTDGRGGAEVAASRGVFRSHIVLNPPAALPFHCLLMLGLCLRVHSYGVVLGSDSSTAFLLMRFLLGELSKGLF